MRCGGSVVKRPDPACRILASRGFCAVSGRAFLVSGCRHSPIRRRGGADLTGAGRSGSPPAGAASPAGNGRRSRPASGPPAAGLAGSAAQASPVRAEPVPLPASHLRFRSAGREGLRRPPRGLSTPLVAVKRRWRCLCRGRLGVARVAGAVRHRPGGIAGPTSLVAAGWAGALASVASPVSPGWSSPVAVCRTRTAALGSPGADFRWIRGAGPAQVPYGRARRHRGLH